MEIPPLLLERVCRREAILFLGAGASLGARHPHKKILIDQGLSDLIAKTFLGQEYIGQSLEYNAGSAIDATGFVEVQRLIKDYYIDFEPAPFHSLVSEIPWHSIFTLNYDTIIEKSYQQNQQRIQDLQVFLSNDDTFEDKISTKRDLPLYKLHGCISRAEDPKLQFILTIEQYITHMAHREALFKTLYEKSISNPIVYVGTSLKSTDIRQNMHKVIEETNNNQAHAYLIEPKPRKYDSSYWATRKVTLLECTFEEFLVSLKAQINDIQAQLSILKTTSNLSPIYEQFILDSKVQSALIDNFISKHGTYVHRLMPHESADPKMFYTGYGQEFGPVSEKFDVRRGITDKLLQHVLLENLDEQRLVVITGSAGSGKTVLLRRVAFEAATEFESICFWIDNAHGMTTEAISEIYRRTKKQLFLFIDDLYFNKDFVLKILTSLNKDKIPVTIFSADRTSTWNETKKELEQYTTDIKELHDLSEKEIESLIEKLTEHDSLGYLKGKSLEEQKKELKITYKRQLLVALHEATHGKPFTEIVVDEYNKIYPDHAKLLYRTVGTINRFGIKVRAGIIARIHSIDFNQFRELFFEPLEGIVISVFDDATNDWIYKTRHPYVAEILFTHIFIDDSDKFEELMRILSYLNVEYSTDQQALKNLTNAKTLRNMFTDPRFIHKIYNHILNIYPSDPFLHQQSAIFLMKENHFKDSFKAIAEARKLAPYSESIKHTYANIKRNYAQNDTLSSLEKSTTRGEAKKLLNEIYTKNRDAYSRCTLIDIDIDELSDMMNAHESDENMSNKIGNIQKDIDEAIQIFPGEAEFLQVESRLYKLIGDQPNSINSLEKAYSLKPSNIFIALSLAKHYYSGKNFDKAIDYLEKAREIRIFDTALNFTMGRILEEKEDGITEDVLYYLRHAFVDKDKNFEAMFYYARALYLFEKYDEANEYWDYLTNVPDVSRSYKSTVRAEVTSNSFLKVYTGTIETVSYNYVFINPDRGPNNIYSSTLGLSEGFKSGDRVSYNLAFNFKGAVAVNLKKCDIP